jgi:hypothetical protein
MLHPQLTAARNFHSTGIHAATRSPITTAMIGKWRKEMSLQDQRIFNRIAGDLLLELGYEVPDLGKMSLAEETRFARLKTKYQAVITGRKFVKKAGIFHPTGVLERVFPSYLKTSRKNSVKS